MNHILFCRARVDYEKKRAPKLAKFCKPDQRLGTYAKYNDKYQEPARACDAQLARVPTPPPPTIWHEIAFGGKNEQLHNRRLVATDAAKASLDGAIVTVWEQFTKDLVSYADYLTMLMSKFFTGFFY